MSHAPANNTDICSNLFDSCSCLYMYVLFLNVIMQSVGNGNAQEAVLAVNVPMSFDRAEGHFVYSAFTKIYLLYVQYYQPLISWLCKAGCCQYTKATPYTMHG